MDLKFTYSIKLKHFLNYFIHYNFIVLIFIAIFFNAILAQSNDPVKINTFSNEQEYSILIQRWYFKIGDDSTWSQNNLDMQDWEYNADKKKDTVETGIQWYRAAIQLEGRQNEYDVLAISANGIGSAYEIFWDGKLIGKNGMVANSRENEIPGQIQKIIRLKREVTYPGDHVIAIRLSNFHTDFKSPMGFVDLGYHYDFLYNHSYKSSHLVFVGGASLIAGLFCVAMFFAGSRHRSYLLFALYCFIRLFFNIYPIHSLYNDINVEHILWISWLFQYGHFLSMIFFITFIIYTFEIPRKLIFISSSILLFLISTWLKSFGYDLNFFYNELLPLFAIGLLIYSIQKKTTGSIAVLTGLVVWRISQNLYLFPLFNAIHLVSFVSGDIIFLFCIIFSISRIINEQNKMLQEIQLRSSRLEVDLLKKNIQPHFILNTLQSIMSWIKKKPDNAFQLIEALAEEFKMINQISDKKFISIHHEIELCNTHLKIMGFRMGTTYELITDGLDDNEQVPPMIFHTLIENALTHSFKTQESGSIQLSCEKNDLQTVYCLSNNGSRLKEVSQKTNREIQEGMGLKYIKARLQESFSDKWNLDYVLDEEQWKVTIILKNNK